MRRRQRFPTRQYGFAGAAALATPTDLALEPGKTYRFILGRDPRPTPIDLQTGREMLFDPFAQLVLFSGARPPTSLRALLALLDGLNADPRRGLPEQRSFVVADGGQIPWTPETDDLQRSFRFAITRKSAAATDVDLLISASTHIDTETDEAFLQVIGWDPTAGAFQFYDRRQQAWIWAGSSWDALAPDSRGKGPFDSHVNGALNMKELKLPWVHWNSMAAPIRDDALAPDDPLRGEPLWTQRSGGDDFEVSVARPGIQRWTAARFKRLTADGRLARLPEFMRQVLDTSTINLAASPVSSAVLPTTASIPLPTTFFFNADALLDVIGLDVQIAPASVPSRVYQSALDRYDVALSDGQHRFAGDTQFLFVVPEPAFEDVFVLDTLIQTGVLSRQFAAALLMLDFPNAVFSPRRAALLAYVPDSASLDDPGSFEREFLARVSASPAADVTGSPEQELLANARLDAQHWESEYAGRIQRFFLAATAQLQADASFGPIFELAESRRREFRKRPLAEFKLTLPTTKIPADAPLLEFGAAGQVRPKGQETP